MTNRWSDFIDATSTGCWYLTGNEVAACAQAARCSLEDVQEVLDDGGPGAAVLTAAVGKGRDRTWTGAVDGLRVRQDVHDFEPGGVRTFRAR
ncbi:MULTISPECIES: hypothetical protein [unclassified Streptomyces]|uniref:hypothetical protein n=1 Tax=unclassified Streptomyces TaxID=2593676 RepID=UPI0035DF6F91